MIIELSLKEAESILEFLKKAERGKYSNVETTLKRAIKLEAETQMVEIDRLMDRLDGSYYDSDLNKSLKSLKEKIQVNSIKAKDKYFDEEGNEKR
jgi:hypothetical protein